MVRGVEYGGTWRREWLDTWGGRRGHIVDLEPESLTPSPHSLSAGDTDPGRTPGQSDPRAAVCECPGCSCSCPGETGEGAVATGVEARGSWAVASGVRGRLKIQAEGFGKGAEGEEGGRGE